MSNILKQLTLAILWIIGRVIVYLARKMTASVENFLIGLYLILLCLDLVAVCWIK